MKLTKPAIHLLFRIPRKGLHLRKWGPTQAAQIDMLHARGWVQWHTLSDTDGIRLFTTRKGRMFKQRYHVRSL